MDVLKLKLEVLERVMQTEDESILSQLKNILLGTQKNDFGTHFSESQLASIKRGKKQLEEGKGVALEDFEAKLQNRSR